MTYRLLLWFDMLEEEGKSTENIRGLFANRTPLVLKDLSTGDRQGNNGDGFGGNSNSYSNGYRSKFGSGDGDGYSGDCYGNGFGTGRLKIIVIKI